MAEQVPETSKRLRTPPTNVEAEKALLGAIILKPEVMHDISVTVFPESFYADKHREIYRAILETFMKGDPIDLLSVTTKLKNNKQLDRVGGATYITELIEQVPAAGNSQYYAEQVQNKAILRGLINAADDIAEMGFSDPENIDETLDQAEKKVYNVTNNTTTQKFTPIGSSLSEAWERFEHLSANQDMHRGVPTGFTSLDNILAGFQKSDLIILAARPSMGKTTLALDLARNAALQHGAHVGIFSLEMSDQQLVDRLLAAEAGVDSWKLRTGKLKSDQEFEAVQTAMAKLSDAPIHIDDQPGNNILKMRSSARRLKNEHGLDLLIVDYLQLMSPTSTKASDSMVQQVTEISRSLKILARELDVPVVALSQLSRAVEQRGGKPRLSDLRDSGSIEQDADVVMFIHREDKINKESERPNIAEILVEKHRNGPVGMCELYFDAQHVRFLNLDTHHSSAMATTGEDLTQARPVEVPQVLPVITLKNMNNLDKLIKHFENFPGIGARQARRFAFHILTLPKEETSELATLVTSLQETVVECESCRRFFSKNGGSSPLCSVCSDSSRDFSKLMVVERDSDIQTIERAGVYDGFYFVLGGTVPLLDSKNSNKLRGNMLKTLVEARVKEDLSEIILGFSVNPDGENTGRFVESILKEVIAKSNLKISYLGRGLSTGSELEYADPETIKNAFKNRT